jgi:hypothetical protein
MVTARYMKPVEPFRKPGQDKFGFCHEHLNGSFVVKRSVLPTTWRFGLIRLEGFLPELFARRLSASLG